MLLLSVLTVWGRLGHCTSAVLRHSVIDELMKSICRLIYSSIIDNGCDIQIVLVRRNSFVGLIDLYLSLFAIIRFNIMTLRSVVGQVSISSFFGPCFSASSFEVTSSPIIISLCKIYINLFWRNSISFILNILHFVFNLLQHRWSIIYIRCLLIPLILIFHSQPLYSKWLWRTVFPLKI